MQLIINYFPMVPTQDNQRTQQRNVQGTQMGNILLKTKVYQTSDVVLS